MSKALKGMAALTEERQEVRIVSGIDLFVSKNRHYIYESNTHTSLTGKCGLAKFLSNEIHAMQRKSWLGH
ncbi:MAG: hypothetical protein EA343_17335 [Nodularia sp. (in: Bacteria)]|nr:MAG: hypothetical protein EA343_17335 [Nodularia sp. (in: cyanobacteria)]